MSVQRQRPGEKSMLGQRVAANISLLQKNEKLWGAALIFLASLFLLGTAPFYPLYLVPLLALLCGAVAYFTRPTFGLILGLLIAFPAVMYQSALFAWLFLLIIVVALFEAFDHWKIISVLMILVTAPFAFGQVPVFGWITILGMVTASLYFGSKKSILIAVPSVLIILLLSSIWVVENNAFMPINLDLYDKIPALSFSRGPVELGRLGAEFSGAVGNFASFQNMGNFFNSIGIVVGNLVTVLVADSGIVQLIGWALVLFIVSYASGKLETRPQLISSLALLILLPFYFVAGLISQTGFSLGFLIAIILSIAVLGITEHFGIRISREAQIQRKDRLKAYGKFGMADIGIGEGESLDDVGNYTDVKDELKESILMPLKKKELAYTYGIKPPSGILLFGPPGTGKTMLMRALARTMKYNFIEVKCSQILSQWYGESEKNLAEVFSNARKTAPTILFFDEIDALGKKRSSAGTDEVTPRVLTTLLQEMDGAVKSKSSVIVIGATNIPNKLDPALLRPGRFDKIIYMHLPDKEGRKKIFQISIGKTPVADDVDFDVLAKKTTRFSGADIKNVAVEAKRLAAKKAASTGRLVPVSMADFLRVISSVKPSTGLAQLDEYEQFRMDFERRTGVEEKKPEKKEITWNDVGGLEKVKKALLEAIEMPLLHEDLMKQYKVKPSKGILLYGPPGTGKTLTAKAASNELNASFQSLSGAELMKRGYLESVNVVRELFNRARENTPAIIFIDEIDTFAPSRGSGGASEITGQLLNEMDGMKETKGVVVIAATNRPQVLDPAIMRPGRFDKIFYIPPPDRDTRRDIFAIHLGDFAKGVDLDKVADITDNFTGADIAAICQEAKMSALRAKIAGEEKQVTTELVEEIIENRSPSVTPELIKAYEMFAASRRGKGRKRKKKGGMSG